MVKGLLVPACHTLYSALTRGEITWGISSVFNPQIIPTASKHVNITLSRLLLISVFFLSYGKKISHGNIFSMKKICEGRPGYKTSLIESS